MSVRTGWAPQLGPQLDAYQTANFCHELFVGGPRGTGKSDFLLADFASETYKWKEKWHGIIFRRSYPQFVQIIRRSEEVYAQIYGNRAKFVAGDDKVWRFPGGSTLRMRHLEKDRDAANHLGESNQWLGFDELPELPTDTAYKRLIATLRSAHKGVPMRIRGTGNPAGPGLGWVKRRFIDPCKTGYKLFRSKSTGMTRMFIPMQITDNRILLSADPGYIGKLKAACAGNPQLARAWILGDWDVFFGQFFGMFDPLIHKIEDPLELLKPYNGVVPPHWRLEGSLDYGESSPTAFFLWATDEYGVSYLVAEYYKAGLWLSEHVANICALCKYCPYTNGRMPRAVWADPQIWYTRASANSASLNKTVADVFYNDGGLRLIKSNRDRIPGWRFLKNELAWKKNADTGEWIRKPKIFYFPECTEFERTMKAAVYDGSEDNPTEDLDTDGDDHGPDSCRYFVMGAHKGHSPKKEEEHSGFTFDHLMRQARLARLGIPLNLGAPMLPRRAGGRIVQHDEVFAMN